MMNTKRAFTLIEIMLVMVILAIMATMVMVNMRDGYLEVALEQDALLLSNVVQSGQRFALTKRCICRLMFAPEKGEYYLTHSSAVDSPFKPIESDLGDIQRLSQGIALVEVRKMKLGATNNRRIDFSPEGMAEAARIVLRSSSGEERIITIDALFGTPKIERSKHWLP
jgi:prepilin-type N-terminal cleavage/methylation domain-containing protein